jgi:hypothetical protein
LHQHIELSTVLVDRSPQQIRLTAQCHEHLVQMPYAARPGPRCFGAPGEFGAELVAPATDRFVRDHDTTLEQQLLDVAQAKAEPEIPPNRAADDDGREAVTVIKRFRFLHQFILPPPPHQPDSASPSFIDSHFGPSNRSTPIFAAHGIYDDVLPIKLGEAARDFAITRGYKVDWSAYPMPHSVCAEEIHALHAWLGTRLAASS